MIDPELFVVRIWHQLAGGFRATVRRVDEDQTRHFSEPEQVTSFLAAAGRTEDPEPAEATRPEPTQRTVP